MSAKWIKDGIFIHPNFKFKCIGCKDPEATFTEIGYAITNFPIYEDKKEECDSHALDRTFNCDLCGCRLVFGLAIAKEHYIQIMNWDDENKQKAAEVQRKKDELYSRSQLRKIWMPDA